MNTVFKTLLLGTFCLTLAACSSTGDQVAANSSDIEIHEPDKVTCKTVVKTGSRVGSKVCKTNRAWTETARRSKEYAENIPRKSQHSTPPSN